MARIDPDPKSMTKSMLLFVSYLLSANSLMQEPVGNGRALVAGIDPDPRETLRAIREQLQIEQVHGSAKSLS